MPKRKVTEAQLKSLAAGRAKLKKLRAQGKGVRKKKKASGVRLP